MQSNKWDIAHSPSEKDAQRWRLKLRIDENNLSALLERLPGKLSRPFLIEDSQYDFGVYIYEAAEKDIAQIKKLLAKEMGGGDDVSVTPPEGLDALLEKVGNGIENMGGENPAVKIPPSAPMFEELELNPRYNFAELVIGPNNRFTAAAAQAVADNIGKIYNPFFIYSGVGLGKTHLMHAVGHYVHKKNPSVRILYVTTEKFMGEVIESIRRGTLQQMREYYRQIDLLLVDDIQFLVESESTQEEFFHTFNVLHQSGKQIIITSDRPPKQLTTLEDRLRSRFEWGLIADIKSPNLETRVAILKKKEEADNLNLSDNLLLYIASKLKSNIRELEGFLKRINAYASLTHQEVNMDLVRTLMSDLLPPDELDEPAAAPVPAQAPAAQAAPHPPVVPQPAAQAMPPPVVSHPPPVAPNPATQPQPPAAAPQPAVHVPSGPSAAAVSRVGHESNEGNLKTVEVGFFFPDGKESELEKVKEHFRDVIKKHKLKFRLEGVFERAYSCQGKVAFPIFAENCKSRKVTIAVVLGPPPDTTVEAEEFANLLATIMDDEKISLQLIPWAELNKDYRYLNLSLDITLLKHSM